MALKGSNSRVWFRLASFKIATELAERNQLDLELDRFREIRSQLGGHI